MRTFTTSFVLALLCAGVSAQNLTPENVLRIHFHTTPPFNVQPDVLRINFGLTTVTAPYTNRRAALYDCDMLLGSYSSSLFGSHSGQLNLDPGGSFKSPTSPWTFDNAATADFTTIVNGSIQGVIDFTIDTGGMTIPLNQVNLNMVRASSSSGGSVVSPSPTITHVAIVPRMLDPTPGMTGTNNTWTVTGATPNSTAFFGVGTLCRPLPVLGTVYDIANPFVFVPMPTDALGSASLTLFVPPTVSGQKVLMQSIEIAGSSLVASSMSVHNF